MSEPAPAEGAALSAKCVCCHSDGGPCETCGTVVEGLSDDVRDLYELANEQSRNEDYRRLREIAASLTALRADAEQDRSDVWRTLGIPQDADADTAIAAIIALRAVAPLVDLQHSLP